MRYKLGAKKMMDGKSCDTLVGRFSLSFYVSSGKNRNSPLQESAILGLVVKKDSFRNGPKNSPFRDNCPFHVTTSINGNGLFSKTDQRTKRNFFYNKPLLKIID